MAITFYEREKHRRQVWHGDGNNLKRNFLFAHKPPNDNCLSYWFSSNMKTAHLSFFSCLLFILCDVRAMRMSVFILLFTAWIVEKMAFWWASFFISRLESFWILHKKLFTEKRLQNCPPSGKQLSSFSSFFFHLHVQYSLVIQSYGC